MPSLSHYLVLSAILFVIGVAGGTGSGKTSLAVKIRDRVGEDRCLLLAQDSYYKDGSTLSPAAQAAINYDHPDALETDLLARARARGGDVEPVILR